MSGSTRIAGAVVAALGASLVAVPIAAAAAEPATATVHVAVGISATGSSPGIGLPGVDVTLQTPGSSEFSPPVAEGFADQQGRVELDGVPYADDGTDYVLTAVWKGAPDGLQASPVPMQLHVAGDLDVTLIFTGTYGEVGGRVLATVDDAPLPDLAGASLRIISSGVQVQEVALDADGDFQSGPLPAGRGSGYRFVLVPPAGYDLAAEQPGGATFTLSAGDAVYVQPAFALTPHAGQPSDPGTGDPSDPGAGAPTGDPSADVPTGDPDSGVPTGDPSSGAPTGTPTTAAPGDATGTPTQPAGDPTSPVVTPIVLDGGSGSGSLVDAFGDISEDGLGAALDAMSPRQPGGLMLDPSAGAIVVPVVDGGGSVFGFAGTPAPAQLPELEEVVAGIPWSAPPAFSSGSASASADATPAAQASAAAAARSVTVDGIDFAAMDIDTALPLASSNPGIQGLTQRAQEVNDRLALLDAARTALEAYLAAPTAGTFATASAAVEAASLGGDFLTASAATGVEPATALVASIQAEISNTQQRLQPFTNERTKSSDLVTGFTTHMSNSRSGIIGNLRSAPISVGSVQWDHGQVTGAFDLTKVPDGPHHLILGLPDLGLVLVASVTVRTAGAELSDTGVRPGPIVGLGAGLLVLGLGAVLAAPLLRRRRAQR